MSESTIQVDYNDSLSSLVKVLSAVKRPGNFYSHGAVETPLPQLDVEGVGTIAFPLLDTQAREIIRQADPAPYGRGEQTIVDTKVRKVWQIAPDRITLGGKTWSKTLQTILEHATRELGCQNMKVTAELYKLLLYDKGGFFVPHRDTEKTPGMFGTLVIVLPSSHKGGELIIRHADDEASLNLVTDDVSQLSFAAFYADCQHEIRPIIEGNRLCLVFSLIQAPAKQADGKQLLAPDYRRETAKAERVIADWIESGDRPLKIAYLLEHQYSPAALSFSGLKNADAALARVLTAAARNTGCAVHLGIVHIEEFGSAQLEYQEYGNRWSSRRRYSAYDDDDAESENADYDVIDVYDGDQYIAEWVDMEGHSVEFGRIPLAEDELLPFGALDNEQPDKDRVSEATGNEGASFERSYHRAAIVIWSERNYPEVLLQAGVGAVLPYLGKRIADYATLPKVGRPPVQEELTHLVNRIIEQWGAVPESGYRYKLGDDERPNRVRMLKLLIRLKDSNCIGSFSKHVVAQNYDGSEKAELIKCLRVLESDAIEECLTNIFKWNANQSPQACIELLDEATASKSVTTKKRSALRSAAKALVKALGTIESNRAEEDHWFEEDDEDFDGFDFDDNDWPARQPKPIAPSAVTALFRALQRLEEPKLMTGAATRVIGAANRWSPDKTLVPGISELYQQDAKALSSSPAFPMLWEHCAQFLIDRSGVPPQAPTGWAQSLKLNCRCDDCRELQRFATDPEAQVHRFRVRKDRRQHLHRAIEHHRLDMTHVTERRGSPQTLVCTKTRATYLKRCEEYRSDIKHLRILAKLGRSLPDGLQKLRSQVDKSIDCSARWSELEC